MGETRKNKATKVLHSLSPNRIAFRHKMAHEIENIQKKLNDVVKDMSMLNLNPNVVVFEQSDNMRRETCSYVLESDIIGREDDKKKIISLLRQSHGNQNVSVVAIVGIGGLGKTALAQLVYNDSEVTKFFEKSMWVCVSDNFDVKTIVNKMLELLTNIKIDDKLPLENLQNMLRENLAGKKYLLVLDDIWNESYEKWAQLRTYLVCGARDSKVIVTTRTKIVAQTMGVSDPYTLNGLTPKQSWCLLKKIITYGDESKRVNQTLELIGKKIAEKCVGVPLAIRTLGGLLQGKSEEREWVDVLQGDFWKLCEDEESIMPVLKLSYQNLSPQLRQCFSYCALYPKDWNIQTDELIHMWMAQGYVECSTVANQFVNILLTKSFFQDAKSDVDGEIVSFKMHDLIHDLAMQVSGNDCCYLDSGTKRLVGSPVHVMLESDAIGLLESVDTSKLRTLILLSTNSKRLNENAFFVISKFKCLRVLMLSHCSFSKLCNSFVKLNHLRYLSIRYCERLGSLSKFTNNLVCLQKLVLKACEEVEISTKVLSKLINLRDLYIDRVKVSEEKKTTFGFRRLCMGEQYKGVKFSNWISPLANIVKISLNNCKGLKYLPPMERLPFLKSIYIYDLDELEYIYYEESLLSDTFFPSLESLNLWHCNKLRGWWRMSDDVNDDGNFSQSHNLSFPPRLSYLLICACPMLTRMPTFPNLDNTLEVSMIQIWISIKMIGSIESPPLSKLKQLFLEEVDLDVKKFPKNWVENLTSLESLSFSILPNKTLQEIGIWFKKDFNYLPSLRKIKISICSDQKTSPDWILKLSSLQHITIQFCKSLASLPEGMHLLAKLQTLQIVECPLLVEECKTQTSPTWPNIAHIPNIILN